MTAYTSTIKFLQDLFQIVIGEIQDGSIYQIAIWAGHHQRLIIEVITHFFLPR